MDRLSPLDAAFLFAEDGKSHTDVGMVLVFDGPSLPLSDLRDAVRARLPLVPRYRQKVRLVPLAAGLPVWVDDADFDVDRHLFHVAAASSDDQGLFAAVSDVMSAPLDRAKPLWEMHLVTGLREGRWALVVRMHHCMVDGVTSTEIVRVLLSEAPEPAAPVSDDWRPSPEPTERQLVQAALAENVENAYRAAQAWMSGMWAGAAPPPVPLPEQGIQPPIAPGLPVTDPTLTGPIGPERRWRATEFPLAQLKAVRTALGGTVNDVMLTACAAGFRDLLRGRGEDVRGRLLRSMVPVSVRSRGAGGASGNQIAAMIVELPVGDPDAVSRLTVIRRQTEAFKRLQEALPVPEIVAAPQLGAPVLLALSSRLAAMMPAYVHSVTSNVPGPQTQLYLQGRPLRRLSACIALWAPLRIAVSGLSYLGTLTVAVVADRHSTPDIDVFSRGVDRGMEELLHAAGRGR